MAMLIFKERQPLHDYLAACRQQGRRIGFVPTMGALHEGHLSLLQASASQHDLTVCSIFVNPTQFNDPEDFRQYPVHPERDIELLSATGTAVLWRPAMDAIYPSGTDRLPHYPLGTLEQRLEGAHRPGHFQGVAQVMEPLLDTVRPDQLFLGQKDYQQTLIIKKLVDLWPFKVEVVVCPTLRAKNGLALSSRNARLSAQGRERAAELYASLQLIRQGFREQRFADLLAQATEKLTRAGFRVEYLVIARGEDLEPLDHPVPGPMVCLAAAWLEGVRLIDNLLLN